MKMGSLFGKADTEPGPPPSYQNIKYRSSHLTVKEGQKDNNPTFTADATKLPSGDWVTRGGGRIPKGKIVEE